ncbi:TonB-dependent receptor [Undibacterium sp. TS12]|uniref:TonB-dependent receptor n=1 Tax=Undibacterium sp. TS12 TaxID=2908202 RepID=UPI001F4D1FAF|nr:TonB-dependent receptor [Undibacterium sp. TS12]MCH8617837.1 TonB-dependent receptor [Undibacterium sp. TS12]
MNQSKRKQRFLRRSAAALIALSGSGISHAQTASTTNNAEAAKAAEPATVVVTARRREESLQDVPVSVTAFSADQLSKTAVPDIVGLVQTLPNTTMKASRATNSTLTAFIRGVGQQDPLAGFEAGVGIYLDDVYIARPQGAVADIYDVERIEVLRGPQGTLYGRNTIGGAVKYVTRKLAPETDVRLKATVGTYGQTDAVLTASTPVSDTFRIGATLAKFKRNGFGKNLVTGGDNYDKDVAAARLSAEFTPNSNLFIRLSADTTQDDSSPKNGYRLTVGNASKAPILDNVFDTRANLTTALGHLQQVKQSGGSALVEWQINNELTLKSITASRRDTSYAPIDFDSLPVVDLEAPAVYKNRQFSQELQLSYNGKTIQGVAGVYYIDANAYNKFDTLLNGALPLSVYTMGDVDTKAWAIFADGSMNLSDTVSVSAGGRYTSDTRQAAVLRQLYLGTKGSPELGNPGAVLFRTDTNLSKADLDRTDTKFTPRLSLNWKANADNNVYASWSQGFKGGGFDPRLNVVGTKISLAKAKSGYEPEEIETLELGLKSQFDKGRIMTNAALFFSNYKNVQIPGSVAVDTDGDGKDDNFAGVTTNAGKARIRGFELEATARITDAFRLSGMFSYIDAKYTQFIVAGVDVASQKVFQNTPKQSANLTATYDWPMAFASKNGTLSLIGSYSYRGATNQFETPNALLDQDAYSLWDASLVWTSTDKRLRAGLHGKNLGNTKYKVAGYLFPTLGLEGSTTAFYGNPRTVSATVEYRF